MWCDQVDMTVDSDDTHSRNIVKWSWAAVKSQSNQHSIQWQFLYSKPTVYIPIGSPQQMPFMSHSHIAAKRLRICCADQDLNSFTTRGV